MADCPICLNRDSATLDAIENALLNEGACVEDLAIEFEIPVDLMMDHVSKCIKSGDGSVDGMADREQDLAHWYEKVKEALETAHLEYLGNPKGSNAQGYTQLLAQFRGMVIELQQLDSPEKLATELANDIVGPLVSRMITTLTEELHRTREELTQKTDSKHAQTINTGMADLLKRLGARLSMDQTEAVVKIQKRFNVEDNAAPKGKGKAKKPAHPLH
jgi:uncharacterized small protein (DUF1192 family)